MTPDYKVLPEAPALPDYLRLRLVAGLSPFSEEAARKGLRQTLLGVTVLLEDRAVGMGRVIGDGGCFFQIVDIAVDPEHQRRGLGKRIMASLMDRLRESAPKSAYVSLIADVPADMLYEQFGFIRTAPRSVGMETRIS
ncbi:MAG: GNAT family N-acetyltransferase [Pseudomonadota bacterium]|nr:GNAT family N-acetyltransferase [Pseudomonadota bacterium]